MFIMGSRCVCERNKVGHGRLFDPKTVVGRWLVDVTQRCCSRRPQIIGLGLWRRLSSGNASNWATAAAELHAPAERRPCTDTSKFVGAPGLAKDEVGIQNTYGYSHSTVSSSKWLLRTARGPPLSCR
ncbi:MAG: hypothetical protein JWP44_4426 [Mucilaginibacter sp.]|jgi:hypothetical protein|nr:hypothetical protein [Mucilaginibacter sp.]